ncbi:MAG: FAD:protein FMN transferase [Oligoflexales bacterium]
MGTYYSVKYVPDQKLLSVNEVQGVVEHVLEVANQQMSTYRPESEISKWNQSAHGGKVSPWFFQVASFSLLLAEKTHGVFDPTVAPFVNAWGFGPDERTQEPSDKSLKRTLQKTGYKNIIVDEKTRTLIKKQPEVQLDLSSTAKGSAVDKVSEALMFLGLVNHFVDVGGEIKAAGVKLQGQKWVVGIEKANGDKQVQLSLPLESKAIATSGNYRNFYENSQGEIRHHTIHPKTGKPIESVFTSVSVVSDTCMEADGLATAFMVMSESEAQEYIEKHHVIVFLVYKNMKNKILASAGFKKFYGKAL